MGIVQHGPGYPRATVIHPAPPSGGAFRKTCMKRLKNRERMPAALVLVREGLSGYAAAKAVKLTPGALYKNAEYREIIAARKAAPAVPQ